MIPRCGPENPVHSGEWRAWGAWAWWVWTFADGWCEWIPAGQMTVFLATQELVARGELPDHSQILILQLASQMLDHVHHTYVGSETNSMAAMLSEHMSYNKMSKSNWYYNSLPGYSPFANRNSKA